MPHKVPSSSNAASATTISDIDESAGIDWSQIDVVLLDMDGTLIDLHFDNMLWNVHLPKVYALTHQLTLDQAREHLFTHMRENARTIEFYCLDYWAKFTELNIMQLHRDLAGLLRYRWGTEQFLSALKKSACRTLLTTNAHRKSLDFKTEHLDLLQYVDGVVSSHDYQQVKESQAFWQRLQEQHPFDPSRALFIDDNEQVLESAATFGIAEVWCVASPDSQREPRSDSAFPMLHNLADLIPEPNGIPISTRSER